MGVFTSIVKGAAAILPPWRDEEGVCLLLWSGPGVVVGVEGELSLIDGRQMGDGDVKLGVPIVVVEGAADQFMRVCCSCNDLEIAGVGKLTVDLLGSRGRMDIDAEDLFWSHYCLEGEAVGGGWIEAKELFSVSGRA